uniref:Major facilitator superfamily (MFS) profile domain-containing protein n=1 Tax=Bionectria ochroleuca TaxID=29856 RepID=A0A8H7KE44_BIOOC
MGNNDIEARTSSVAAHDINDGKPQPEVGREHIHSTVPPHDTYEGRHRFDPSASWSPEEERKVVRKTDWRLLTWLCVMFFGLQLDRGNLSNALADNLLDDLGLTTDDYNNGTTIQLLCFLGAEFPVQFLTKRYGFKNILPGLMCAWGLVSTFQAFMKDRTSFYITRAFIGLFEGGFIPGAILMATYFYTSRELSIRLAAFWSTLNVARVISALLAAGLLEMRGVGGHPGWFWLFLLEGLLTLILGIVSFLYLPTSPTGTKSPFGASLAKGLTNLYEPATFKDIKAAWGDKSMWGLYLIGLVAYIPATPVQAYLTLTLKRVGGFNTLQSNLLTAPSAALQIITMLALAYSSEYFNERAFHCLFGAFWSLPMLTSLITLPDGGEKNTFDVKKRAITAATYNVIVQIGSVIGNQIYRKWDSPYYKTGNKVCVSILALSLIVFIVHRQYLVHLNNKKETIWSSMSPEEQLEYQTDKEARQADGNKRLDFRFAY